MLRANEGLTEKASDPHIHLARRHRRHLAARLRCCRASRERNGQAGDLGRAIVLQCVAAPCRALYVLLQFQMVSLNARGFAAPYRNAVATFVLQPPARQSRRRHSRMISRDRQSSRGLLDLKTSAARRGLRRPAVSLANSGHPHRYLSRTARGGAEDLPPNTMLFRHRSPPRQYRKGSLYGRALPGIDPSKSLTSPHGQAFLQPCRKVAGVEEPTRMSSSASKEEDIVGILRPLLGMRKKGTFLTAGRMGKIDPQCSRLSPMVWEECLSTATGVAICATALLPHVGDVSRAASGTAGPAPRSGRGQPCRRAARTVRPACRSN
jgi:hypothetical protein